MVTHLKGGREAAATAAADHTELRHAMVRDQIFARGIRESRLLEAMRAVPRHEFVPHENAWAAYDDRPLPIAEGQTISQPFMVAAMTAALELKGAERVLEIGTGSGYQAAILSLLAREVHTVETHPRLAQEAEERLAQLGRANVRVHTGDGTLGWPDAAPYDAILVTAASPGVPPPLLDQLGACGRLVIPVGNSSQQELWRIHKGREAQPEILHYCRFVPLVGRYGWQGSPF